MDFGVVDNEEVSGMFVVGFAVGDMFVVRVEEGLKVLAVDTVVMDLAVVDALVAVVVSPVVVLSVVVSVVPLVVAATVVIDIVGNCVVCPSVNVDGLCDEAVVVGRSAVDIPAFVVSSVVDDFVSVVVK